MKLIYYKLPYGFDDAIAYTDSLELFLDLWDEWLESQLLKLIKNTPMDDWWHYMGGGSWELFLPSFYYTHTEEKIERITAEVMGILVLLILPAQIFC